MQNTTFRGIALVLIIGGLALAGFRWFFADQSSTSSGGTQVPPNDLGYADLRSDTEQETGSTSQQAGTPEQLVRCVVVSEDGQERVLYYPKTVGCPEGEQQDSEDSETSAEEGISEDTESGESSTSSENFDSEIVLMESRDLRVSSPSPDAGVSSPFQVDGEVRSSIETVYIRITNPSGKALIEQTVPVNKTNNEWNSYSWNIHYEFQSTKEGFVEVYTKEGNKEANMLKIPVSFN